MLTSQSAQTFSDNFTGALLTTSTNPAVTITRRNSASSKAISPDLNNFIDAPEIPHEGGAFLRRVSIAATGYRRLMPPDGLRALNACMLAWGAARCTLPTIPCGRQAVSR